MTSFPNKDLVSASARLPMPDKIPIQSHSYSPKEQSCPFCPKEDGKGAADSETATVLDKVSNRMPHLSWSEVENAMTHCVQVFDMQSEEVAQFMEANFYPIVLKMISFIHVEGNPNCYTELQRGWRADKVGRLSESFHIGLSDAMRIMVRIGRTHSRQQLTDWCCSMKHGGEGPDPVIIFNNVWVNCFEKMLDIDQPVYCSDEPEGCSSVWHACCSAFSEEDGFNVLLNLLDSDAFKCTPEKAATLAQVFHCKLARMLKLFIDTTADSGHHTLNKKQLDSAMMKIGLFCESATGWMKERLALETPSGITLEDLEGMWQNNQDQVINVVDGKCMFDDDEEYAAIEDSQDEISFSISENTWTVFTLQSRPNDILWEKRGSGETTRWRRRDFLSAYPDPYADLTSAETLFSNDEFCYCILDLMEPAQSLELIQHMLLPMAGIRSHQVALRMAHKLNSVAGQSLQVIYIDFLRQLQHHLRTHDEGSMRCLIRWEWASNNKLLNTFQTLMGMVFSKDDKLKVYTSWGEIGLACFCTSRCSFELRRIGGGLLESLASLQHWRAYSDFLAPSSQLSIAWLSSVCVSPFSWFNNFELDGTWRERIASFLRSFCHNLSLFDRLEEAKQVADIWLDVAISHLRLNTEKERLMGFDMLRWALEKATDPNLSGPGDKVLCLQMSTNLSSETFLQRLFETLFTTLHCYPDEQIIHDHIPWIVQHFYRVACYEPIADIDITKYLVEAVVNTEWDGLAAVSTKLIIDITMINISIMSLNNLCKYFKEAISNTATSVAAYNLVLEWVDKTRHKKWVVAVQEKVLDLLWHILMETMETESDNQRIEKLLEYFTNQFRNIRNIVSDLNIASDITNKRNLAKQVLFFYLKKCMCLVNECGNYHSAKLSSDTAGANEAWLCYVVNQDGRDPVSEEIVDKRIRRRSSLAVAVLNIALARTLPAFPPDMDHSEMLEAINVLQTADDGILKQIIDGLLVELFLCCKFSDVSSAAVSSRLTLIEMLLEWSSKLPINERVALSFNMIQSVWNALFCSPHQSACLAWLCKVLEPHSDAQLASGAVFDYFQQSTSYDNNQAGDVARSFILDQLYSHLESVQLQVIIGTEVGDMLLRLLSWVKPEVVGHSRSTLCLFTGLFELEPHKAEELVVSLPLHLKQQVMTECLKEINRHRECCEVAECVHSSIAVQIVVSIISSNQTDAMHMVGHFPHLIDDMVQELFSQTIDLQASHVKLTLEALAVASSVSMELSLSLNIVEMVFNKLVASPHQVACIDWLYVVLPCDWSEGSTHFKSKHGNEDEEDKSRSYVYDQLCKMIRCEADLQSIGVGGVELLVSLHSWTNRGEDGCRDTASWNQIDPKFPLFVLMQSPIGRAKFIISTLPRHIKTCSVCFDSFSTEANHVPRSLSCRHLLCTLCSSKILKHHEIKCPLCKSSTRCTDVFDIPKDFTLLSLMEMGDNASS